MCVSDGSLGNHPGSLPATLLSPVLLRQPLPYLHSHSSAPLLFLHALPSLSPATPPPSCWAVAAWSTLA